MSEDKSIVDSVSVFVKNEKNIYKQKCDEILKDEHATQEILDDMYAYCGLKGLTMMSSKDSGGKNYVQIPCSLLPHLVSLSDWLDLRKCSKIFHKLIDAISRDSQFLLSHMKCIAEADPNYTGKFYAIYAKQVKQKEFNSKYIFNSLRCDYMRNGMTKDQVWSQIEAQFTPGVITWGAFANELHAYVVNRYVMDEENQIKMYDPNTSSNGLFFTPNNIHNALCKAISVAAKLVHAQNPLVLMVADCMLLDCHMLALTLWQQFSIKTIFRTYSEIGLNGKIEKHNGTNDLIIDGKHRISFIYCREGSKRTAWQDPNGNDWLGRELIEFSSAVSDCNIAYQLLNTKYMQTIYSQKDILLKYLKNEDEANFLYRHFVANYNFDSRFNCKSEIQRVILDAKRNPNKYVMKPSGDGGGWCVFGENIIKLLNELIDDPNNKNDPNQLQGWILMEKIKNCTQNTIHVRDGMMKDIQSVHELGIFSQYLCDAETGKLVIIDECIGDIIKCKNVQFNEAGLSAGFGVVDSVLLDATATKSKL